LPFRQKLNPQQREAVESAEGPILILAGAGSGKTRVITYRIAHLIDNLGVAPDSILAVTFTNKAAKEMTERVEKLVGGHLARPWISTFHSMCVRMLRRDIEKLQVNGKGLTKQFVIYDEGDQQSVVKAAMKRLGLSDKEDKQFKPNAILSRISWAKSHMMDPQEYFLSTHDPKAQKIAHIYKYYKTELAKSNALDFDDLLLEAVRLLKSVPQVREYYERRFHYMLVDEYQDTNRPQYELLKLLAGSRHNICAVGDEDQSIYSWRGADIRNILEFERDFSNAKIIRLEQNYRSTQNILQGASAVVANNVQRKGKNLWTERQGGSKIGFYEAPDGENEALFAADYISKYISKCAEEGQDAKAAILYRTNSQSRLFEEALRRYGLKYHVVGGFSFYERAEIRDMISYLKVVQNPDDSIALQRIINTPTRGIGKSTMEIIERVALETGTSIWGALGEVVERKLIPLRAQNALKSFREIIDDARAMLAGTFTEQVSETAADEPRGPVKPANIVVPEEQVTFDLAASVSPFGNNVIPFRKPAMQEDVPPASSPKGAGDVSFEFGDNEEGSTEDVSFDFGATEASSDDVSFDFGDTAESQTGSAGQEPGITATEEAIETAPGASVAEILKYIIDRTRYIKLLEAEDTPEAQARVENLRELVNADMDSRDRGETIGEFLDHAALVSDADQFEESAQITLMTLHAAKGLEFPLVCLVGLEEGLFPHSRTFNSPEEMEEERRLCYVGMTRAMDTLVISRARYRRRWGTDMPEASVASRFLGEIPPVLIEDLSPHSTRNDYSDSVMPNYEDEDQRPTSWDRRKAAYGGSNGSKKTTYGGPAYNSIDNIAEFFASRGKKFNASKIAVETPAGDSGFRPGQRVKHPKYGEGTVFQREGDGDMAKITVQFSRFGLKKLVEKYAQLQKA
jgi:DNA helicase-2/ATP-dependent DNA helicase PcrA